jgi:hypothetical protein
MITGRKRPRHPVYDFRRGISTVRLWWLLVVFGSRFKGVLISIQRHRHGRDRNCVFDEVLDSLLLVGVIAEPTSSGLPPSAHLAMGMGAEPITTAFSSSKCLIASAVPLSPYFFIEFTLATHRPR